MTPVTRRARVAPKPVLKPFFAAIGSSLLVFCFAYWLVDALFPLSVWECTSLFGPAGMALCDLIRIGTAATVTVIVGLAVFRLARD